MPSTPEVGVRPAVWTESVVAEVGASIYALQPSQRLAGGQAAHAAGMWVHADLILRPDPERGYINTGVGVCEVLELLEATPEARVEIHLMVLGDEPGWERAVDEIVTRLEAVPVCRWSARPEILARLQHLPLGNTQRWVEVHPPSGVVSGFDGVLVMLIEPGSKGTADPAALDYVAAVSAKGGRVGVDGGVTSEVAQAAVVAGASHLVVGRALWPQED